MLTICELSIQYCQLYRTNTEVNISRVSLICAEELRRELTIIDAHVEYVVTHTNTQERFALGYGFCAAITICELSAMHKRREENIARWLFYDADNL